MLNHNSNAPDEPGVGAAREERLKPNAPALALDPSWRAGRKLAEARAQLGLSLDEVAERIRVRREFLEALEQMNMKLLPGKAYALAFLRSYAGALGVDEKAIVDQFQDEVALTRESNEKQIRAPASRPRKDRPWMAAAALVALGVGFVGWRALDQEPAADPAAQEQAGLSPAEMGGALVEAAPTRRVVEIKAVTDGWLEARGPDGTVFLSRTLRAGEVYRPDPSPGWTLHARDGGAFELL
ncbi:MAG: helix-turn-helix domain-containing protein [Terricaulis sp.]|nr:helix-turn-helix domain-containing protein [Terricaulis sp.]